MGKWDAMLKEAAAETTAIQNHDGTWSPEDVYDQEFSPPEVKEDKVSAANLTRQKMQEALGTMEADESVMSTLLNTSMNDIAQKTAEVFGMKTPLTDAFFGLTEDLATQAEKDSVMGPFVNKAIDDLGVVAHEVKMFNQGLGILMKSVPQLYTGVMAGEGATIQGLSGMEFKQGMLDKIIDNSFEAQAKFSEKYKGVKGHFLIPGITFQDVSGATFQWGLSLSAMINGATTGALGTFASGGNPAVGAGVGASAMWASTYRQTANLAMREILNQANVDSMQTNGRPLTEEEWYSVQRKHAAACARDGVIEATASVGSFIADVILTKGGGKVTKEVAKEIARHFPQNALRRVKNKAGELLASALGVQLVEQTEEAATQYFQEWNHFLSGMQDSMPSIVEAAKKTMGPTFLQSFMMFGAGKAMNSSSLLKKIFITRGEKKIDEALAKEAAVSSEKTKEMDAEIAKLIGEDHAEQLLMNGEEVKPLESTSASNPAEQAVPGAQMGDQLVQGPIKEPKVVEPDQTIPEVPDFPAELDNLVLTGHAANVRDAIKVATKEKGRIEKAIEAHQIVYDKRWGRLSEALSKDWDNEVAKKTKKLEGIDKKIEAAIDARDEVRNDNEFKALNLLNETTEATGDTTTPQWKEQLSIRVEEAEKKLADLVNRKRTLQKWLTESEWLNRNPDVKLMMDRLDRQEARIEELKALRDEKEEEIAKKGNRLFEVLNTEIFGGNSEVADQVNVSEKVQVKVGQLNRVEEMMWERQINAFYKGLKEGKRTSYKYAQQTQRHLARLVKKSKLTPEQKLRAMNKILSIKNVDDFSKSKAELKGMIKEMRVAKMVKDIKSEIIDTLSKVPMRKNKDDKSSRHAVDVVHKSTLQRVLDVLKMGERDLQNTVMNSFRMAELMVRDQELSQIENPTQDVISERNGIAQELQALAWERQVAAILKNPSVSQLAMLRTDLHNLVKEGEAAFLVKQKEKRKATADAVNSMVGALREKYGVVDEKTNHEQKAQAEKSKTVSKKIMDGVKAVNARLIHLTSVCRRLDLGYAGEFTKHIADKFMRMCADKTRLTHEIRQRRLDALKGIDDMLTKKMGWTAPIKHVANLMLPSERARYFNEKTSFQARVEKSDVRVWRTAAHDRITAKMQEYKDNGRGLSSQEYNVLLSELMAEEETKFKIHMEETYGIPSGELVDAIYDTKETVTWTYTRGEMIMIYLLNQNAHQREALTHPLFGRGIPEETIRDICETVETNDLDKKFAEDTQAIWQWEFNLACDVSEQVTNMRPKQEDGYCPMRKAFEHMPAKYEVSNTNAQVQFGIQEPRAASLMERSGGTAPVSINLMRVIDDHDREMANYIATAKGLDELGMIVNTSNFQDAVKQVLTESEFKTAFVDTLNSLNNPGYRPVGFTEKLAEKSRLTAIAMTIGFNFRSVLANISNLIAVMRDVGPMYTMEALYTMIKDRVPGHKSSGSTRAMIHENSTHIKFREHDAKQFIQGNDLVDATNSALLHHVFKTWRYVTDEIGVAAYLPLTIVDNFLAETAWLAAYNAAQASKDPAISERAADHANLVVKNTQVIFGREMLPEGLKDGIIKQQLLVFYSFFNQMYQSELAEYQIAYQKGKIDKLTYWQTVAEFMKIFVTYDLMPTLLNITILAPFALGSPEEILKELMRAVMNKTPAGASFLTPTFDAIVDEESTDNILSAPIAFKPAAAVAKGTVDFFRNEVTREDIVNILGVVFKEPSTAHNRYLKARDYLEETGDTSLFANIYMPLIGEKNYNRGKEQ